MGRKLDVELCFAIGRAEDLQRAAEGFDPVDQADKPRSTGGVGASDTVVA